MTRRDWKRIVPTSLNEAFRLCKEHAIERKKLSAERIADLMGVTVDSLYKWLGTGRMPANLIAAYEHVCGIDYVSRHLAHTAGKLVIAMPTGRALQPTDGHQLQILLNDAVGAVLDFAAGTVDAKKAIADIEVGMAALAWHRGNVDKHQQPELDLEETP